MNDLWKLFKHAITYYIKLVITLIILCVMSFVIPAVIAKVTGHEEYAEQLTPIGLINMYITGGDAGSVEEIVKMTVVDKNVTSHDTESEDGYEYTSYNYWLTLKDNKDNEKSYSVWETIYDDYSIGDAVDLSITDKDRYIIDGKEVETQEQIIQKNMRITGTVIFMVIVLFIGMKIYHRIDNKQLRRSHNSANNISTNTNNISTNNSVETTRKILLLLIPPTLILTICLACFAIPTLGTMFIYLIVVIAKGDMKDKLILGIPTVLYLIIVAKAIKKARSNKGRRVSNRTRHYNSNIGTTNYNTNYYDTSYDYSSSYDSSDYSSCDCGCDCDSGGCDCD